MYQTRYRRKQRVEGVESGVWNTLFSFEEQRFRTRIAASVSYDLSDTNS